MKRRSRYNDNDGSGFGNTNWSLSGKWTWSGGEAEEDLPSTIAATTRDNDGAVKPELAAPGGMGVEKTRIRIKLGKQRTTEHIGGDDEDEDRCWEAMVDLGADNNDEVRVLVTVDGEPCAEGICRARLWSGSDGIPVATAAVADATALEVGGVSSSDGEAGGGGHDAPNFAVAADDNGGEMKEGTQGDEEAYGENREDKADGESSDEDFDAKGEGSDEIDEEGEGEVNDIEEEREASEGKMNHEREVYEEEYVTKTNASSEEEDEIDRDGETSAIADGEEDSRGANDAGGAIRIPPAGRRCRVEGCNKYKKARSDGYCTQHFHLFGLDPRKFPEEPKIAPPRRACKVESCSTYRKAKCDGYCLNCYRKHRETDSAALMGDDARKGLIYVGEEGVSPLLTSLSGGNKDTRLDAVDGVLVPKNARSNLAIARAAASPSLDRPPAFTSPPVATPKLSKYCNYPTCTRYKQTGCYGYCLTHVKDHADPTRHHAERHLALVSSAIKKKTMNRSNLCKWQGCEKYIQSNCNGYCLTHVKFANYEEEDGVDVVKVRMRVQARLQNGFCQAILPVGLRQKWGFSWGVFGGDKDEMNEDASIYEDLDSKSAATADKGVSMEVDVKDEEEDKKHDDDAKPEVMDVDNQKTVGELDGIKDEDDGKAEGKDESNKTMAASTESTEEEEDRLLDFKVMPAPPLKKFNGATKCRAVGCDKNSQGNSAGFCRAHHNRYLILTGRCGSWDCVCGEKIASFQARCGRCHRWRGGKHAMSASRGEEVLDEPVGSSDTVDGDTREGATLMSGDASSPGDGGGGVQSALTYVPSDAGVWISPEKCTNERGRPLCKVVGCRKMDQSNNDGFCRMHFNMFAIADGSKDCSGDDVNSWMCVCGTMMSGKQKRCSRCNKWRGGKRDPCTNTIDAGISLDNVIASDVAGDVSEYWLCDCGNSVPSTKSRCGRCHHWRGGRRRGGWKLSSFGRDDDSDDGIDRSQDWTCCGTVIPARQTRCGKCNGWRGGKRVASSTSSPASVLDNKPPWNCNKCQISNPGSKRRCGGCLAWKGAGKGCGRASSGGYINYNNCAVEGNNMSTSWKCVKCNFDNFATELTCFVCKALRLNWQWHKKQQLISSSVVGDTAGVSKNAVQALCVAPLSKTQGAVTSAPVAQATGAMQIQAPTSYQSVAADVVRLSQVNLSTNTVLASEVSNGTGHFASANNSSSYAENYYGNYSDGWSYPFICIHYDFNQAYYKHHDYSYLNNGIKSRFKSSGGSSGDDDDDDASGFRSGNNAHDDSSSNKYIGADIHFG